MITNANLILFAVLLPAALGLGAWLKHSAELRRRAEQKKLVRRVISSAPAARGSRRDMVEFEDLNERAMRGGHAGQLNAWSSR